MLHAFREEVPAGRWQALYEATWPAYRSWYVRDGVAARPSVPEAEDALQRYMPELVPTWRRLVSLTGDNPISSAMLSHWKMPAFAPACSQAVVNGGVRALIRNYDYHPDRPCCVGRGAERRDCRDDPFTVLAEVCAVGVPLPARGDRGRGALVSALWAVLP